MVPSTVVSTCEHCLAFLRTSSGSYRAGVLSRMAPILRSPVEDSGSESEVVFWARPSDRRGRLVAAGVEANAPIGEVGRSSRRAGAVPLRPDLPVGDWAALPAYRFRLLGRALTWKPVPEEPRIL